MTMQQDDQRERAFPARPGDVSFNISPGAWVKEADGLLTFESAYLLIGNHSNAVTSKQKR